MTIRIARNRDGAWRDEGRMTLTCWFQAHPTDEITQLMIRAALVATGAYEGGGVRLTIEARVAA